MAEIKQGVGNEEIVEFSVAYKIFVLYGVKKYLRFGLFKLGYIGNLCIFVAEIFFVCGKLYRM